MSTFRAHAVAWRVAITLTLFAIAGLAAALDRPRMWLVVATGSFCIWFAYWLHHNTATFADPRQIRALQAAAKAIPPGAVLLHDGMLLQVSKPSWGEKDMTIYRSAEAARAEARADLSAGAQITTVMYEVFVIRGRYMITSMRGAHTVEADTDGSLRFITPPKTSTYKQIRALRAAGRSGALHVTSEEIDGLLHQLRHAEQL
ncbi:hypothetical protein [Streptosporangium sp. NPDC048865]|uniref:hypothetical protein n=1 Tax=Streptosporangium sp. NPDC048865 TaxID=3155766 RepID=UPI003446FE26